VEAFVYLRVRPGTITSVRDRLASSSVAQRSVVVVGEWDVMCLLEGPDLEAIAGHLLGEVQLIEGVDRTLTAPVVPPDRLGIVGFGGPPTPPIVRGASYVHIAAEPGAAAGLYERLSEVGVAGAAVLAGRWDLLACIAEPWEVASGVILDKIQPLPGVRMTSTLVSVDFEEHEEDRDQFSAWS
jgi:DNA-binding Lrp family transcriptional regulator